MYSEDRIAKFWSSVTHVGECWEWKLTRMWKGYGQTTIGGKVRRAHRVAWELTHGKIPKGLHVLHRCDNPACIRPEHLFLGTAKENQQDCVAKGRKPHGDTHYQRMRPETVRRGDDARNVKLTSEQVEWIRKHYTPRVLSYSVLAAKFGVTKSTIAAVILRRNWV